MEEAIQAEHHKEKVRQCVLGTNAVLHPDARINNFQNRPESINIGKNTIIRGELQVNAYGGKISIGEYSYIGEMSRVWSGEKIIIGSHVQVSHNVNIIDCNTHSLNFEERQREYLQVIETGFIREKGTIQSAPVIIEDHAWISFNAAILKGVTIGKGAIVAANSVVTKDVKPFTMVAGNPAVEIKTVT